MALKSWNQMITEASEQLHGRLQTAIMDETGFSVTEHIAYLLTEANETGDTEKALEALELAERVLANARPNEWNAL